MAKTYDEKIKKSTDWGGDESTGNLPVKGSRVQEFIKGTLEKKIGLLYYDLTVNRYLAFADEDSRDEYLADTGRTDLILGTFDAPFNYSASIKLLTSQTATVFKGSTGNRIEFTFDTVNKEGSSVGEGVICTYTFMRGTTKKTVTAKYGYGEKVSMVIDDYLLEGTNTITIGIQGQTTLAATTVSVIYRVISLSVEDDFDIAAVQDLTDGVEHSLEIPYTVSGQGTKTVEWYIDGVQQGFAKDEDEITEATASRTKYLSVTGLSHGRHSLQIRVSTSIDGEKYYSDILYREFMVVSEAYSKTTYVMVKYTIPSDKGIRGAEDEAVLYDVAQYEAYTLKFAVYNPASPASTPVDVIVNGNTEASLNAPNGQLMESSFTVYIPGDISVKLSADGSEYAMSATVAGSSMDISEITAGLDLAFSATGRSNSSSDRGSWSDGKYDGVLNGFLFNETSGWVDNSLHINEGASFGVNSAPLGSSPEVLGRTIEFSFRTVNVSDDNAVVCDLTKDGVGLKLTASEASLTSREGRTVSTKFKSEEDVRVSFVINRRQGATNHGLAFIYVNGILSGATKYAQSDSFESDTQLLVRGLAEAEVKLYQIRTYNTALSHDQVLNNFILYQKTAKGMQEAYYRNDVLDDTAQLSVDKLQRFLPIMVITGNIPVLENTNNKKEQIIVDAEYTDLNNPERSFTVKNAVMTPQGTSSMSYPKKNFRLYTCKLDDTRLFDWNGNAVEDRLYAFKENAQPVNTWCFKADYAESSGTHNTGIARLWNTAMYNARIDGEYKLRTAAQAAAVKNGYPYDVRTTVDGFPILMFYRLNADSDLVFIGKYNFNNDKSTESVYGFKDIPGFDNSRMQCWEVLNNGNHLALFQDTDNWDTEWSDAFEGRYPDGSENTTDLKSFADWLVGCKNDADKFKTEKWNHLDVYKVAAYYVYLMRFGAVDQPVKNAMFTSEDGEHFYFINYDNDTVLGVRNDGLLIYPPTITRQSLDTTYTTEVYAYAGHDSVLWNRLEADEEFMSIVSVVDNALYQAGLRYADVIGMFDDEQASKWCERIYNQDSQYKYVGPYVNDGVDNLFMLQGSRTSHRKWWLSRRFNLLDSMFVSGAYKSNVVECKLASAPARLKFGITAGFDMGYGYGVNNVVIEKGVSLKAGESHEFTTRQVLNIGDPMRIYTANNLQGVDISGLLKYLSTVNIASVYDSVLGTRLKSLILGDGVNTNTSLSEIQGLSSAQRLEVLNIEGCEGISSLDLSKAYYFRELYAKKSGLKSVDFPSGAQKLTKVQLPSSIQSLVLRNLPSLEAANVSVEGNFTGLLTAEITGTPKCATFDFVSSIVGNAAGLQRLVVDNIDWTCSAEQLISLVKDRQFTFDFKGHVALDAADQDIVNQLNELFGEHCFDKSSAFYITAPDSLFIVGADEVLEGDEEKYSAVVFSSESGTGQTKFRITSGSREGTSIDSETGLLTTTENGLADSSLTLTVNYIAPSGKVITVTKNIKVKKRTYPDSTVVGNAISGPSSIEDVDSETVYTFAMPEGYTGRIASVQWSISGDAVEQEYIEITKQTDEYCKIRLNKTPGAVVTGTVSIALTKVIGGTIEGSKLISVKNGNIAISKAENPYVMQVLYAAGLCASEDYMTKTECALVSDEDFKNVTFNSNKNITSFTEFRYFTGITAVPDRFMYNCSNLEDIVIPEGVTKIGIAAFNDCSKLDITEILYEDSGITAIDSYAFNGCKAIDVLHLPKGLKHISNSSEKFTNTSINEIYVNDALDINLYIFSLYYVGKDTKILHLGKGISYSSYGLNSSIKPEKIYVGENANFQGNDTGTILIETSSNVLVFNYGGAAIPDNVTEIQGNAIQGYAENLKIPSSVTYIGRQEINAGTLTLDCPANAYRDNLIINADNVYLNKGITSNSNYFYLTIQNLYIGKDAKTLGTYAGNHNYSIQKIALKNVEIDDGNTSLIKDGGILAARLDSGEMRGIGFYEVDGGEYTPSNSYDDQIKFSNELMDSASIKIGSDLIFQVTGWSEKCSSFDYSGAKYVTLNSSSLSFNGLKQLKTNGAFVGAGGDASVYEVETLDVGTTQSESVSRMRYAYYLHTIYMRAKTAPSAGYTSFYYYTTQYAGCKATQPKILYVPADSTGYDEGYWKSDLIDKCGFTLMKTL